MKNKELFTLTLISLSIFNCVAQSSNPSNTKAVSVELKKTDSSFQLLRGGKPYFVKAPAVAAILNA